jgi:hypothetical protein
MRLRRYTSFPRTCYFAAAVDVNVYTNDCGLDGSIFHDFEGLPNILRTSLSKSFVSHWLWKHTGFMRCVKVVCRLRL